MSVEAPVSELSYPELFRTRYRISLQSLRSSPPDSVICGPVYRVETSSGLPVRFDTYVYRQNGYERVAFFGYDADDIPIAYRDSIYHCSGPNYIALGYVGTALRGKGVGSATELVHQDMLSRIAQRTGMLVIYEAVDDNSLDLQHAYSDYKKFISDGGDCSSETAVKLQQRITIQEQEHARWLAIFGPDGKYGYDATFSGDADSFRMFPPGNSSDGFDLEQIDSIHLDRDVTIDRSGRVLYSPKVVKMETGTLYEVRERKLSRLRALTSLPEVIRFSHVSPTY